MGECVPFFDGLGCGEISTSAPITTTLAPVPTTPQPVTPVPLPTAMPSVSFAATAASPTAMPASPTIPGICCNINAYNCKTYYVQQWFLFQLRCVVDYGLVVVVYTRHGDCAGTLRVGTRAGPTRSTTDDGRNRETCYQSRLF
jgi:hypothetical protein